MHNTPPEKTSPAGPWDTRTGWSLLKQLLLLEPLPGGSRWSAAFGSLLLFAFLLQVVTGVLLAMNYAPSSAAVRPAAAYVSPEGEALETVPTAWASVKYTQEEAPLGGLIRGLHHWGSSAMVVLLLVHMVQVFVWGAYKKPRELTWMVGVLLLACVLGLAITGYLLPWDQKAYWATKVGLGIAGTTPVIGDGLRTFLQGGPEIGNLTLTRFFTLHGFVLPGLVILLTVAHLYLFRLHGVTPSWWQSGEQLRAAAEPFWPRQALKDGALALVFLVGLALWAYFRPAPLEAPANPARPYEARPEWYFMFLFQLLRYFHGPYEVVGTFVLPALFFLVLFFWPLLDRSPHRDPRRRPFAMTLLGAGTAGLVGLTVYALTTDVRMTEPAQAVARAPAPQAAGPIQKLEVARVYGERCAACHDVDGSGRHIRATMPTVPDFTSLAWQMAQTDLDIAHRIMDGKEPLMPAFRDKLGREQNLGLTIYVRSFGMGPAPPAAEPPAAPRPAAETPTPPGPSQMSAGQLYGAYCLACHDADGRGSSLRKAAPDIPDFTDAKWHAARSDAEIGTAIREGKGKLMLPMKDKLAAPDVGRMIAYLRAFRGGEQVARVEPPRPGPAEKPAPKTDPAVPTGREPERPPDEATVARTRAAGALFQQYCLSCHGTDGRGAALRGAMPALPDFTSRAWQESRANPQLAVSILEGKGALMPAFRGRVSDAQAGDLTAYVRAFGPARAAPPASDQSDFEKRFRELEEEWKELQRQMHELDSPPRKPSGGG
jgi:ubiquinol-cytochrome c reductase cytochrome b subunit